MATNKSRNKNPSDTTSIIDPFKLLEKQDDVSIPIVNKYVATMEYLCYKYIMNISRMITSNDSSTANYLNNVYALLATYSKMRNPHLMFNKEGIFNTYRQLRKLDNDAIPFLLSITTELGMVYNNDLNELYMTLAGAYTIPDNSDEFIKLSAIAVLDNELHNQLIDEGMEVRYYLLKANKWFASLLLISLMDTINIKVDA